MGNGEAKELICMTHGHKLMWRGMLEEGEFRVEGVKRREKLGQL